MAHAASHDHHHAHGHGHPISADADRRLLIAVLGLILAFMVAEVVVGLLASSLALLTDAAHMLTDAAAIALALVALRIAARPPGGAMTYGYGRVEALSGMANGVALALLGAWFVVEGILRLFDPPEVAGGLVLAVALAGIAVNLLAARLLARANRRSLNIEGAFQHILTDLYAFIATALAGGAVLAFGFDRADAIAALIVAALMLRAAHGLVIAAGHVVLEGAPAGFDPSEIGHALAAAPDVEEVHDLHVWELGHGFPALSAHVMVRPGVDCHAKRRELDALLRERFSIRHTTLQVDHAPAPPGLLTIEPRDAPGERA